MEVKEVQGRARALEETLAGLLAGFEDETGTAVQRVGVSREDVSSFGDSASTILAGVSLVITI